MSTMAAAQLLLLLVAGALAEETGVKVTRTALHVARSLDPETTETLNVRTRSGEIATLIVKKRGGKANSVPAPVSVTSSSVQIDPDTDTSRDAKQFQVPAAVYIRSAPVYVKGDQEWKKSSRSLIKVDSDGIPVVTGVRMPDDESDRQVWRNARVINNVLVPQDKLNLSEAPKTPEIIRNTEQIETKLNNNFQPIFQHSLPTVQKYNTYYTDTRDRIIEYINSINARETSRHHARSRMLKRSDNPDNGFQARVLQYPASTVYPTSLLYTPANAKSSRVSFEEGVRTPVLQYAHPELGVQPAKVARKQDYVEIDESKKQPDTALAYFNQDIHSDRSPYAYEPVTENDEEKAEVADDRSLYDKRSGPEEEQDSYWPKRSLTYLQDDSYGLGNDKYIKRYPYNGYSNYDKDSYNTKYGYHNQFQPYGHSYFQKVERPFWERLGERIKEHVQSSMEKVTDLTRPVVEPLMEASQKISHNLGLSSDSGQSAIQEKVGGAVAAYPVLLPALGLVAGGAALGLGAVAVGRYLDVDMMRRSTDDKENSDELSAEHKRAIEQMVKSLTEKEARGEWGVQTASNNKDKSDVLVLLEEEEQAPQQHKVSRRSADEGDNSLELHSIEQMFSQLPGGHGDWSHTPCAKRMFCDVMLQQPTDSVILMEKKMATFLALIQRDDSVSFHLSDVMDAVKRRDCSAFTCSASAGPRR